MAIRGQEQTKSDFVDMETKLGWNLTAKLLHFNCHNHVNKRADRILSEENRHVLASWDKELLGIRDYIQQNRKEGSESAAMIHFEDTIQQKDDGRYGVHSPWKKDLSFLTF